MVGQRDDFASNIFLKREDRQVARWLREVAHVYRKSERVFQRMQRQRILKQHDKNHRATRNLQMVSCLLQFADMVRGAKRYLSAI